MGRSGLGGYLERCRVSAATRPANKDLAPREMDERMMNPARGRHTKCLLGLEAHKRQLRETRPLLLSIEHRPATVSDVEIEETQAPHRPAQTVLI